MKFNIKHEVWVIHPHIFIQAFSKPGNHEHLLWSALCQISLETKQDPLVISADELASATGEDKAKIIEMLEGASVNGSTKLQSHNNG